MDGEAPRSRAARVAAEAALVRVVHHYGSRPEFVVLGGLVPELLCSNSPFQHAGTTDVDVQVNLEIACGAVNTVLLERALRNAEFEPDAERVWRWVANSDSKMVVNFELLADLDTAEAGVTLDFNGCKELGAVNLRGTGFAARDIVVSKLSARIGDELRAVEVNVSGLSGFLLAKTSAAYSRRKPKDWYDLAFVLLHNDAGGVSAAEAAIREKFGGDLGSMRTALDDLRANFHRGGQGPQAYAAQMLVDHPELDAATLLADAELAVESFHEALFSGWMGTST
jgi:hypothetical protein